MKKKYDLALSFVVQIIVIFWAVLYYRILSGYNMLISLDDISAANVLNVFFQHVSVNLPVIILLIAVKRIGGKKLFFNMPSGKIGKIFLGAGVIIYCVLLFYGLNISNNIIKAVYASVFYLLFVSFAEEYIFRGLIPALQKDKLPEILEWLLPNAVFALSHYAMLLAVPSGASGIEPLALAIFFISTMIFGMIMELLKRKSNSLFVPILVHAVYDYYGEIMLWI